MSGFEIICQSPYAVNAPRTGRGADHQTALSGRWLDAQGIRLSCVGIRGRGIVDQGVAQRIQFLAAAGSGCLPIDGACTIRCSGILSQGVRPGGCRPDNKRGGRVQRQTLFRIGVPVRFPVVNAFLNQRAFDDMTVANAAKAA